MEFCTRALFLDSRNVKALFRRAMAHKACSQFDSAISDLACAATVEPDNDDVKKELRLCEV